MFYSNYTSRLVSTALALLGSLSLLVASEIETVIYEMDPFDEIVMNGAFEVHFYQDGEELIKLEGPEDLIHEIDVIQRGKRVTVGNEKFTNKSLRKVILYVHMDRIQAMEINGISKLTCETPITAERLDLMCNGIRDVEMTFEVDELDAEFAGIGSTYLYGHASNARIDCAGLGNLYATGLKVGDLYFVTAGIGKAEVYADEELHIDASGIGSVYYAGDPPKTNIQRDGIGKVRAMQ